MGPDRATGPSALLLPLAAIIGAMAAFQIGAAFATRLFPAIGPQGAAALRIGIGAVLLLALTRPWKAWPRPAPLPALFGLGAAMAGGILLFYFALQRLPQGVAMTLQFLGPLGVALFNSRRPSDLAWVALAAGGVVLLTGVGHASLDLDPIGVAIALGAGVCWGGYILFGQAASAVFGRSTAALAVSVAAVLMLPVGLQHAGLALFSPALLPLALLVAVLSTAIPFSLELYALARLPTRTFAIWTSLEPGFGVLAGFVMLGQRLAIDQVGGVLLVIAAAAGSAWTSRHATLEPIP